MDLLGDYLQIFTDGSKLNKAISRDIYLAPLRTVYQAEVSAMRDAVTTIRDMEVPKFYIALLTNSQAVVRALSAELLNSDIFCEMSGKL